jgi:hypothetical protein
LLPNAWVSDLRTEIKLTNGGLQAFLTYRDESGHDGEAVSWEEEEEDQEDYTNMFEFQRME